MAKSTASFKLTDGEKNFLTLVHQAIKANPFSDERAEIDRKIAGIYSGDSPAERIKRVVWEVKEKIKGFENNKKADINLYKGQDKLLFQNAILFHFFHLFIDKFDNHIAEQIHSGTDPIPVKFAKEGLRYLTAKGFDEAAAIRNLSLCFQLRRAYYFIKRGLSGKCPSMINLKKSLWNNVFTYSLDIYNEYLWSRMEDFSTLLLGDTGTGKGAVAAAVGRSGFIPFDIRRERFKESFTQAFVSINLSQFSENLIESELFGHNKGAFTGAVSDRDGVFSQSSPYGAIFLDEIGDVSIPVQIKLLKVLDERAFFPVGSYAPKRFEGRIIAATNRPIKELVEKKYFRPDFFYRLCSDLITVPSLRQRIHEDPAELDELLSVTIERILGRPSPGLARMVKKAILKTPGKDYSWPGNVRELAQCTRRILMNHTYSGLPDAFPVHTGSGLSLEMEKGTIDALSLIRGYCHYLYTKHGTYGKVARQTKLDRRTVKKYIEEWIKKS